MKNQLPNKITPCPIHEAVFELRFETDYPDEAIFGIVFNAFKKDYEEFEALPILQIPNYMRKNDLHLKNSPYYKMENNDYLMQIGPKVLSLSNKCNYEGWSTFEEKINIVYKKFNELDIIKTINRIALRYINVFPNIDIFENSSVNVTISGDILESNNINVSTQIIDDDVTSQIKIISGAQVETKGSRINASIIDIDTFTINTTSKFKDTINNIHGKEKKLFYKLIGESMKNTLNPEY